MTAPAPFPLIEIAGDPRERGRQYGAAAADRVHRAAEIYLSAFAAQKLGPAALRGLVDGFVPAIERFDPAYLEEMRGIAEGAHCPFEHVVVVNARTELLAAARRAAAGDNDGCTGAVILPERSADGVLIHGQNWDWRAECLDVGVVLRIRREDGPDVLTFTEAGALARSGLNAAGIGLTANFLGSDRDYRRVGVPLVLIRRKVLESTHYALALRAVYATQKSCSNNMILSHADGEAVSVECAPDEVFPMHPEAGLLTHANHFESPAALSKLRDTGLIDTPDSTYRARRVRASLARAGTALTADDMKEAFFDDFGTPHSVCRPPRPSLSGGNLSATVMMVVMRPGEGWMEIAPMPALNRSFTRYALDPAPLARAAE